MGRFLRWALAAGWSVGSMAGASDVAFLVVEPAAALPGADVRVSVARGAADGPVVVPWPGDRAEWMFVNAAGDQENRHDVRADGPNGDSVAVRMPESGIAVVGLDLAGRVEMMSASELSAVLAEAAPAQGVAAPGAQPERAVRVRRLESMSTIVRVSEPGREASPSQIATAKSGLRASIRPVMDPTGMRVGGDVPFRVYTNGRAVRGGRLVATSLGDGRVQTVEADSEGIAVVHIGAMGAWRLEFHHAAASADDAADRDLYSATLTFEVSRAAKEAE